MRVCVRVCFKVYVSLCVQRGVSKGCQCLDVELFSPCEQISAVMCADKASEVFIACRICFARRFCPRGAAAPHSASCSL